MGRPTTALLTVEIPGRGGTVRVHRPSQGKASFRVVWTDDQQKSRERTFTDQQAAETAAQQIAEGLALGVAVERVVEPTLGDLLAYHLFGDGRSKKWRSPKSARRPAQIARRVLVTDDLDLRASDLCRPAGHSPLQVIMDRAEQRGCEPGGGEYAKTEALLKTLFDIAERDGLLTMPYGNPMADIPYRLQEFSADPERGMLEVKYVGEELRPPTDRVLEFIDAARTMFGETLAFAGLRPGEANALSDTQLRTDHDGLTINQQLLELTAAEAAELGRETMMFCLPKWRQIRNAWLPPGLLERLQELATSERLGPQGVLFPSPSGKLRRQGNWRRNVFIPVAEHVGWPRQEEYKRGRVERPWLWPTYAFRHHYANYLLKDLSLPLISVARHMAIATSVSPSGCTTRRSSPISTSQAQPTRGVSTEVGCRRSHDVDVSPIPPRKGYHVDVPVEGPATMRAFAG
jgi:integrase